MMSLQGLIVLGIVAWYSLVIMKSTNSYYKEAYKKHLEEEAFRYQQGLVKELHTKKEQKYQQGIDKDLNAKEGQINHGFNTELKKVPVRADLTKEMHLPEKKEEEYCYEDIDSDVCFSNSKEALIYEKMYKNYP